MNKHLKKFSKGDVVINRFTAKYNRNYSQALNALDRFVARAFEYSINNGERGVTSQEFLFELRNLIGCTRRSAAENRALYFKTSKQIQDLVKAVRHLERKNSSPKTNDELIIKHENY